MPKLTIDGQAIHVEAGTTVIQAAERLGIYVPRYCYHPGLSIAGSCRMCMVEVENLPTPQIACNTLARDGMVVLTNTEKIAGIRRHMLEFLLTNHPLDCPVCDQSGECDLQNFYMEYGRYDSRYFEDKIKRKKAYAIGPHVNLDQERCILCSRCIRFTEEISRSHELGVFNRGNSSVVDLYPGRMLDNPYSGNVIDICPVGALTEREFRFRCRVWYLSSQASICPGCSRGCNISVHFNGSLREYKAGGRRIQRLKPRFNPRVNHWWICDEGRFGFEFIDENRIEFPQLKSSGSGSPVDWDSALTEVATAIRSAHDKFGPESLAVIASPRLSNEELFLIKKLFGEKLGTSRLGFRNPDEKPGIEDDFLIKSDKNPNTAGAEALGFGSDVRDILAKSASGDIKVLYVFGHEFETEETRELFRKAPYKVFQGTNWNRTAESSDAVLAGATYAEKDGTFTNCDGLVQHFQQVVRPIEDSRSDVDILLSLAEKLEIALEYGGPEDIFSEIGGTTYAELDAQGEALLHVEV